MESPTVIGIIFRFGVGRILFGRAPPHLPVIGDIVIRFDFDECATSVRVFRTVRAYPAAFEVEVTAVPLCR